jgi:hypothetical protein
MEQDYKELSFAAFERSEEAGLEPKLNFKKAITEELTKGLDDLCCNQLGLFLLEQFGDGYWGNECLNIAPQMFAALQHLGFDCDLVYGEVAINGTDEFDTTLTGLLEEFKSPKDGAFAIHVWLQIGKDLIVDPTIAARINKYYSSQYPPHKIIVGKSKKLLKELRLDYKPMLIGAKFVTKTCGIPLYYNADAE